jgi:hypothetical protein
MPGAARSKALVRGRLIAGIVGSNPLDGIDVLKLNASQHITQLPQLTALPSHNVSLFRQVCVCACVLYLKHISSGADVCIDISSPCTISSHTQSLASINPLLQ